MIPGINTICMRDDDQDILQLFGDKCFKIASNEKVKGEFCLDDFAFPSDGYSCVAIDLDIDNGDFPLFDNKLEFIGSPNEPLKEGNAYARAFLIKVEYPTHDIDDEEIDITDKKVKLIIENGMEEYILPLYNLFIYTTNPKSSDPGDLINKIIIVNPNDNFKVKVTGLIISGNAE